MDSDAYEQTLRSTLIFIIPNNYRQLKISMSPRHARKYFMICPLCQLDVAETKLIASPLWQKNAVELAHKMNPKWDEVDGCCNLCFDGIRRVPQRLCGILGQVGQVRILWLRYVQL